MSRSQRAGHIVAASRLATVCWLQIFRSRYWLSTEHSSDLLLAVVHALVTTTIRRLIADVTNALEISNVIGDYCHHTALSTNAGHRTWRPAPWLRDASTHKRIPLPLPVVRYTCEICNSSASDSFMPRPRRWGGEFDFKKIVIVLNNCVVLHQTVLAWIEDMWKCRQSERSLRSTYYVPRIKWSSVAYRDISGGGLRSKPYLAGVFWVFIHPENK